MKDWAIFNLEYKPKALSVYKNNKKDGLKLIYTWVKTDVISKNQFEVLITEIMEGETL